jgi:hypothetical protein
MKLTGTPEYGRLRLLEASGQMSTCTDTLRYWWFLADRRRSRSHRGSGCAPRTCHEAKAMPIATAMQMATRISRRSVPPDENVGMWSTCLGTPFKLVTICTGQCYEARGPEVGRASRLSRHAAAVHLALATAGYRAPDGTGTTSLVVIGITLIRSRSALSGAQTARACRVPERVGCWSSTLTSAR